MSAPPLNRTCKECGTAYHDRAGRVDDPRRHCPNCGSRAWYAGPDISPRLVIMARGGGFTTKKVGK